MGHGPLEIEAVSAAAVGDPRLIRATHWQIAYADGRTLKSGGRPVAPTAKGQETRRARRAALAIARRDR